MPLSGQFFLKQCLYNRSDITLDNQNTHMNLTNKNYKTIDQYFNISLYLVSKRQPHSSISSHCISPRQNLMCPVMIPNVVEYLVSSWQVIQCGHPLCLVVTDMKGYANPYPIIIKMKLNMYHFLDISFLSKYLYKACYITFYLILEFEWYALQA